MTILSHINLSFSFFNLTYIATVSVQLTIADMDGVSGPRRSVDVHVEKYGKRSMSDHGRSLSSDLAHTSIRRVV